MQALQVQQETQGGGVANFTSLINSAVGKFCVYLVILICYLPYFISFAAFEINGRNVKWRSKSPGKRGHIVVDTLSPLMFLGLRKPENICCGHKMFLNKITNIFCVPDTKFVSATNVARAGKRGNICVGNNVFATMCPRLSGP